MRRPDVSACGPFWRPRVAQYERLVESVAVTARALLPLGFTQTVVRQAGRLLYPLRLSLNLKNQGDLLS